MDGTFTKAELERARRQLERGRAASEVLEELSRRLMNKLLHEPTRELREKASEPCTSTS